MPTYSFSCKPCSKSKEILGSYQEVMDNPPACPECSRLMERDYNQEHLPHKLGRPKSLFEGKGLFLEHADENGKWFKSQNELRKWCREKGVNSSALL